LITIQKELGVAETNVQWKTSERLESQTQIDKKSVLMEDYRANLAKNERS